MKRGTLSLAVATAIAVSGNASAGQAEEMEKTLQALQEQVVAMQAEIVKMKAEQGQTSSAADWTNKVSIGGAVEFLIAEGGAGSLDKVELEITAQATDATSAYVKLKKQSDDSVNVDEASVTHDFGVAAVSATTGGHPFGDFSSSMVSDPMTKDIGDTDAAGARLIAEVPVGENVTVSLSLDDDASSIAATAELGDFGVTVGHITDVEVDATKDANHISASYAIGDITLYAEQVDTDGVADASNLEVAYAFTIAGHDAGIALGRQERTNSATAANNEKRNMFAATVNLDEGLDLTIEKMDSDNNANDAWQAQIAYGF